MTEPSRRARPLALGWLCIGLGVTLLGIAALSALLFVRSMADRAEYARASLCSDEPVGGCYVEVAATVIGKRVDARSVLVDDHVLELNEPGGPAVTLADGRALWSAIDLGDSITLRLWRGDAVHVSGAGQEAETVESPRVGPERVFATGVGALGLAGLLVVRGLGLVSVRRKWPLRLGRGSSIASWIARTALVATCIGIAGVATEVYTRAAPIAMMTALGAAVVVAVMGLLRLTRVMSIKELDVESKPAFDI